MALDPVVTRPTEDIIVNVGAIGALFNAFGVLVTTEDEILVPDPEANGVLFLPN